MEHDREKVKNILIIGEGSYIGEALYKWLKKYPEQYSVDIVSPKEGKWRERDFRKYPTVIDLAGIAHINHITEDMRDLFYSVNRDLTAEIGGYAKENGVKHFLYFSSMNVYGDSCYVVNDRNAERPTSFYGDSKLQGDMELRKLEDKKFVVAYIRPPFVYGRGCRGNYQKISKIARRTPVFPDYQNKKSMIYIDNLCEFVRLVIEEGRGGILTPQNKELVSTAYLVKTIAEVNNHKIKMTKSINWMVKIAAKRIRVAGRAFADDCYNRELSDYYGFRYCVVDFKESIYKTETSKEGLLH